MAWTNPQLILFHGTHAVAAQNILNEGVSLFTAAHAKDFGQGFYTTTNLDQAQEWANFRSNARRNPAVVKYVIPRHALDDLLKLIFLRDGQPTADNGYWDFIIHCRSTVEASHMRGNDHSQYDIVMGPVAKRWHNLPYRINEGQDQISFHTDRAVAMLNSIPPELI